LLGLFEFFIIFARKNGKLVRKSPNHQGDDGDQQSEIIKTQNVCNIFLLVYRAVKPCVVCPYSVGAINDRIPISPCYNYGDIPDSAAACRIPSFHKHSRVFGQSIPVRNVHYAAPE
jgi:hypothetical protein